MFRATLSALIILLLAMSVSAQERKYTEPAKQALKKDPKFTFSTLSKSDSGVSDAALLKKINSWGEKAGDTKATLEGGVLTLHSYFVHQGVESQPDAWRRARATQVLFDRANEIMAEWGKDFDLDTQKFVGVELRELDVHRTESRKHADGTRSWKMVATAQGVILIK